MSGEAKITSPLLSPIFRQVNRANSLLKNLLDRHVILGSILPPRFRVLPIPDLKFQWFAPPRRCTAAVARAGGSAAVTVFSAGIATSAVAGKATPHRVNRLANISRACDSRQEACRAGSRVPARFPHGTCPASNVARWAGGTSPANG